MTVRPHRRRRISESVISQPAAWTITTKRELMYNLNFTVADGVETLGQNVTNQDVTTASEESGDTADYRLWKVYMVHLVKGLCYCYG